MPIITPDSRSVHAGNHLSINLVNHTTGSDPHTMNIDLAIKGGVYKTLLNYLARKEAQTLLRLIYNPVVKHSREDLIAFAGKDPAARGCWKHVFDTYSTFHSVFQHRIAHELDKLGKRENSKDVTCLEKMARKIAEAAKFPAGIEINPSAQIGAGFVVDHGWGVVIGETAVIGKDCYFLNCITIGARGAEGNLPIQRHPIIGDRVQVCGHVNILGHIHIGNDVIVQPYAVVTKDVPPFSLVRRGFNQIFPRQ
jgi:serine O-acetyltransferase